MGKAKITQQQELKAPQFDFRTRTVYWSDFRNFLFKELENMREWNPKHVTKIGNIGYRAVWLDGSWWEIRTSVNGQVTVTSTERFIHIHANLRINCKQQRFEVQ